MVVVVNCIIIINIIIVVVVVIIITTSSSSTSLLLLPADKYIKKIAQCFLLCAATTKKVTFVGQKGLDTVFRVGTRWKGSEMQLLLSVQACSGVICLRETRLTNNARFDMNGLHSRPGGSEG